MQLDGTGQVEAKSAWRSPKFINPRHYTFYVCVPDDIVSAQSVLCATQ